MSFSINNNQISSNIQRRSTGTQRKLGKSFEQLSSGKRINRASDDPAGLSIAENLRSVVGQLNQAVRNGNDGISVIRIADEAMSGQSGMLDRMRELSVRSQNGTLSDSNRQALNDEFQQLKAEMDRSLQNANFNGESVFKKTTLMVGEDPQTGTQEIDLTATSASALGIENLDISTAEGAAAATDQLNAAAEQLGQARSVAGAAESRVTIAINNTMERRVNLDESRSRIEDADIASVAAERTKNQILLQQQVSLMAIGNLQPQQALALLG